MQDDVVLDWKDWTFFEKTSVEVGCTLEGLFTSVFKSCAGALCLDNFPGALHSSDTSVVQNKLSDQCIIHDNDLLGTSLAMPAVLVDEQLESYQLFKSSEGVCVVILSSLLFISFKFIFKEVPIATIFLLLL